MAKYNKTICEFLKRNSINLTALPDGLNKQMNSLSKETILSSFLYSVYDPTVVETVPIKNLAGTSVLDSKYTHIKSIPLLSLLEDFFDQDGGEYHKRSMGLLDYSSSELVSELNSSFDRDPIYLTAIEEKLYVTINGNHRAFVLLFHELSNNIKGKYVPIEVKAHISHLNLELSGLVFLLKQKFGTKLKNFFSDTKNRKMEFMLEGVFVSQSVEEFREFAQKELSNPKLTFSEFRELCLVALENGARDIHFKTAMNFIFPGFSNYNISFLKTLFWYTEGMEHELEAISVGSNFSEYIEAIKNIILKVKLDAFRTSIEAKKTHDRKVLSLENQKKSYQKALAGLDRNEMEELFNQSLVRYDDIMKISENDLEEEETQIQGQIFFLQDKIFAFQKRKKIKDLTRRLEVVRDKLETPTTFSYQGSPITKREYLRRVKMMRERPQIDFFEKREKLNHQILDLKLEIIRTHHFDDRYYSFRAFKKFCEDLGISIEKVLEKENMVNEVENIPHQL